ncbi:MAG: acyl-CoA thioesterase [Fibrobacteres bacterium]|nr:acyl-CoA thioesterase [Fibrobacterota bacterium]
MEISLDLIVRYAETDQMGIVHHSVYPIYFEAARVELMKAMGFPYNEMEMKGFYLPVIDLGVTYKNSAKFGDTVTVKAKINPFQGVRVRIDYEIMNGSSLLATGHTVHVFTGTDNRPCRPFTDFVDRIK